MYDASRISPVVFVRCDTSTAPESESNSAGAIQAVTGLIDHHRDADVRFTRDRGTNFPLDTRIDKHDAREKEDPAKLVAMTKRDAGTNMCTGLRGSLAL